MKDGAPFMGVPLEVSAGSVGEMVAVDGAVTSQEGYSRPQTAQN